MESLLNWWKAIISSSDLPAWLQAFAAIVALVISVWAVFRADAAQRRRDRLQARAIAVAIYPEILKLEIMVKDTSERFAKLVEMHGGKIVGQSLAADIHNGQIAVPPMLERNIDRLFMLGEPAGATCLQLVNVIWQYNDFVSKIAARAAMMSADQWPEGVHHLQGHLTLLDGVVAKCKRDVAPMHDAIKG